MSLERLRPAARGLVLVAFCLCLAWFAPAKLPLAGLDIASRAHAAEANQPREVFRNDAVDALSVVIERPHLVFEPEEKFQATVVLNLHDAREAADKPVRASLKWKVVPPGSSRSIAEGVIPVPAFVNSTRLNSVPLELRVPGEEGVYNVRLSATGRGFAGVERVVQLVVVDPNRGEGNPAGTARENVVDTFEPASAGPFRKVTLTAARQRPASSLSRILKLKSAHDASDDETSAEMNPLQVAFKLRVTHPGHPHRLELAVPRGLEQSLTVSVMQADEQGQLVAAGPDGTISVAARSPEDEPASGTPADLAYLHRQIFWPRDREPILVIRSRRPHQAASVSRVSLFDLGETLPETQGTNPPNAVQATQLEPPGRLVGRYLHKPRLAENFGAPRAFDSSEHCSLDDWQTFLLAGRRLSEYLRYEQDSALMLAVLADGATLYPSRLIEPSLVYDNGRLAPNGQDPMQKDVLELLLRLFDRANLALVVELQFDARLPALEQMLARETDSPGDVLLVDRTGRTRADDLDGSPGGASPYNALSPRVQQAVLDVVHELLDRYKGHPSLAGVAFELRPESFLQLPGIDWGYDGETIGRFEREMRMRVPRGDGNPAAEAHRHLTTTARREWLRFRCAEISRFHKKLADLVARELPRGRVIFSGQLSPLGDSGSDAAVVEAVRSGGNPGNLLISQGLDFSQPAYASSGNVTLLRPIVRNDEADRLAQAALATLNSSPAIDVLYRGGNRGGLISTVAGAESPASGTPAPAETPAAASPTIGTSRFDAAARRYAHLVAALDPQVVFDGGPTFPLILDDGLRSLRQTLRQLPLAPFRPVGPQTQPAVVRIHQAEDATWLYAVNDSTLALSIDLVLDCPAATTCLSLASGQKLALENAASGKSRLRLPLAANGLAACRLDRAGVEVLESRTAVPEGRLTRVQREIDVLRERMNAIVVLAKAGSKSLSNPGFEQPGADSLPGWQVPVEHAAWTLDEENPRSGTRSLRLSAEDQHFELESPVLPLEGSRYVTMSLWMRSNRSAARVQMQFEATIGGEAFRHQTIVEVDKAWKQYVFQVDELPAGRVENARLRLGAVDSCKLWIDDVEIDAQSFSPDEVRQLTKTLSSVKLAFKEGRYADCQRLLDGYWGQLLVSEPVAPLEVSPARPRLGDRLKKMFRRQ